MRRAVNPQTGEVLFLVNNQWTPPSRTAKNPQTGQSAYLVNNEWQILDPIQKQEEEKGFFDKVVDTFTPEPGGAVDRFLEAAKPEPFTREVLDVPLKFAEGVVTTSRAATEAFGANNEVAQNIRGVEKYLASLASAQSKQDSAEISRIMKEAEDKGVGEQLRNALKAFTVAPIDFLSQAAGSTVPILLGAVAGAPGVLTTAGLVGAGVVKGTIYDTVKEELVKAGVSEKEADARAQLAQEYGGENLDLILGGTALGVVAGRFGVEKYILGKIAAKEVAKDVAEKGVARQALETGVTEAVPEALQAGQEQLAANIALQREGFDVPTFRGVAGQAALESIAGGTLGAGVGAAGAIRPRAEEAPPPEVAPEAPPEITPEEIAPETIAPEAIEAPEVRPGILQTYTNPLDESAAEVISTPDNRFAVRFVDLATGQSMDGGTFATPDEANSIAAQVTGMAPKAIQPPAVTPTVTPTVTPPTVTPEVTPTVTPTAAPVAARAPVEPIEEMMPEVLEGAPMPKPEELERAEAAKARLEEEKKALTTPAPGRKNLYATLTGRVDIKDVLDISPESTFNFLKSKQGSTISDLIEDGVLNEFLPPNMRPDSESFDFKISEEYIKEKLRSNDYIPYDVEMRLRENDLLLEDAEKILEFYDVNKRLQEITREELALAEAEAASIDRPEDFLGEPEAAPPASEFGVREPTPEDRRRADLERDLFRLTPPAIPERTTPPGAQGDMFGARGVERARPAQAPTELTPIERAAAEPKTGDVVGTIPLPDNMEVRIFKTSDGYGASMYDKDADEVVQGSVRRFKGDDAQRKAEAHAKEIERKVVIPETKPTREEQAAINRARQAERRAAAKEPEKAKIDSEKEKVRGQLKLFEEGPITENEDNPAGKAARRDAVSTVDDLQSTNTPLALALSKDYAARQRVTLVGQTVKSHDDLAVLSQVYRHPRFESFRLFFVNDAGEIVSQLGLTSRLPGSSNAIIGSDGKGYLAKVQDAAKKSGATGVWMLHNHPSGNPTPSNADKLATRSFAKEFTDLNVKGHIVIDTNAYSVIDAAGSAITISKDMSQEDLLKYDPQTYREIFEPISIAKKVDENPESMVVIALNNDLKVTGISTIENSFFKGKTPAQIRRALYKRAIANTGGKLLVASRDLNALKQVAVMVEDGIHIKPNGQYDRFQDIFSFRRFFLFPAQRPAVVTTDTSKLFDFLRVPKKPSADAKYLTWPDFRLVLDSSLEQDTVTINVQEPQTDLFGKDAEILSDLNEDLPKAKKKLPPGRSPELAEMAQLLQQGKVTKEEFDAAVNKYRPIPLYGEPLEPATEKQVVDALSVDKKPKANIDIPTGTKVGLRLDIPAWNNHKTFVVSIHEGRPKITSSKPGKAIGYRSVAMAKNVTFGLGDQRKALEIAAGQAKDALQTMEGEYVEVSPADAFEMAKKAIKDDRYVQVGFDPTRHAYFYDRKTTQPIVKADAILQIGNMILARGVEYGQKESFLYNIDAPQPDLFSTEEQKVLEKTDDAVPGAKVVTKNRSPELTAAAEKLRRGEITKKEYEEAVQRFSPVSVYAEPPKPASNAQVVDALDANKKKYANVNLESGTKVGLRLDIPAWENKKTWVVAIHKGKPKTTTPKAPEILSYRSVASLKNVVFGVGDQAKTLRIAAGEFKDKLQTMEGEYVNISPEEALRRAQELINDPTYIQVGFNPTRHAYFYDRRTMLPVVSAGEVLQIGNFILAKDVTYGTKEDFLFDIDSTPEMTEAEIDDGITRTREEQIAEYARLRARRAKLIEDVIGGGATLETQRELTNLTKLTRELKDEIDAVYTPSKSPETFLKRALEAYDKGDLSAEVLATIQDAYNKTPFILNGLRLSIKSPKEGGREVGNFNTLARIVTLWNGTRGVEKPTTIRHELTHSLEQMMTSEQRKVVIDAWQKSFKKAIEKNTDPQSQLYFKKVLDFIDRPSQESFFAATSAMPSYEFYQYITPSEYWAVNAETLMAAKLGKAWDRFVSAIKKYLEALKNVFGFDNRYAVHKTFDQLMSDKPKRMSFGSLTDFVAETGARPVTLANIGRNIFGQPMPEASWGRPDDSKMDNVIYTLQDKMVDTKRVLQSIRQAGKQIIDKWNPYLQEELYHGRTAKQTDDFLKKELEPLMKEMGDRGLTMAQVEEYLHNRHAKSRNEFNAKRDPNMPDGGSGIMTADAQAYLDGLDPKQKRNLETVAKMVDDIVKGTQEVIVATGQESQDTIDAWNKALKNYVPLQREETDYDVKNVGIGVGSGFAVKGPFSRAAVGSSKKVVDILANLAMQRERAIVRGEKMRVAKALYGLVASNPNPGFWLAFDPEAIKKPQDSINELVAMGLSPEDAKNLIDEPVVRRVDPVTNMVVERPNSLLVNSRTSMPVRINGKEKYIIFNAKDPRAERMAEALKNLDADQLGKALNYVQQVTQYFAKINTQYNPIFGVINFLRDVQGALLQLSTTPLRNDRKKVLGGVTGALRGIYAEERLRRKGEPPSKNSWAELWEEFQQEGGQTGFRDQFSRTQERADALQAILDPSSWTKSPLGKVFTAGGTLKVPLETARKVAAPIFDWLSDYNQTMENAVRLSAYKVAKEKGMTKQQAASLAKNLTVNFNRKGQIGRQAGALYAFFNAAVQGTARMLETLRGPAGKTIIGGGLLLGSAQAMMLAALGFDEDEPPEFVKERNIIIPTGGSKYITIPMPLGYNVIPNTSRILTEWTLSGFKDTHKRVAQITGAALDMFNPLGNAGWSVQTLAPTVADPFVALAENKDWTGKPIAKEDISNLDPTPGYTRSKETASYISKAMAKFLNFATGGTDYTPGLASPTPDQIDYLIGQLTGGVGRELLKAEQTVTSQFTGEELPIYKVPLVGRFIGDSEGQAAERNRFYNNLILLNKHEREIKGRLKDRVPTRDYLMEYPEARLYSYANQVERNIRALRKQRDMLIEKGAPKERVKRIENQMTVQMQRFNERVKQAQDR